MEKNIEKKREKEKEIVTLMIKLYCKGNKHDTNVPCKNCSELIDYANKRADLCPVMENKTFCSKCHIHCYRPDMQERIKKVMRYSGPRMIFHHPIMTIRHMF